jgi:hypothetical protein
MKERKFMNWKKKIVAITPFICVICFVILLEMGYAHPGWLVFLLIPIMPFLVGVKHIRFSYALIVTAIYVSIGVFTNWSWRWHPGWIIFLTIPVYQILVNPKDKNKEKEEQPSEDETF